MAKQRAGQTMGAGLVLALAIGAAAAVISSPASAATTTVAATGATITRSDATAGTTLTVKATVAKLDLWCTSNKLVVNKKATAIPCNRLLSVTTTGLTGNDTVAVNATGFGSSLATTTLAVKTGAGNDTIGVRHRGSLTVYAGAGNDKIEAGLATGTHPVNEQLLGEDGNDTLTNLGFITATKVMYDWEHPEATRALRSQLRGGPGADRLVTEDARWSDLTLDSGDVVTWKEGPATLSPERAAGVAAPWTFDVAAGDPNTASTLTIGTVASLTVNCVGSADGLGRYRVNSLVLPEACARRPLGIVGTDRPDVLTYDQKLGNGYDRYGLTLRVDLRGGNDTATVRHPMGSAIVRGGAGEDTLTVGVYNSRPNGELRSSDGVSGEAGDDLLTNLGFLDPNPPAYDPNDPSPGAYDFRTVLDAGLGSDRLVGAPTTVDRFQFDGDDSIADSGGPAELMLLSGAASDTVKVRLGGTTAAIDISTAAGGRTYTAPALTNRIDVQTGAGNDSVTVEGKSTRTPVTVDGGAGSNQLRLRPAGAYATHTDPAWSWISQVGAQDIRWATPTFPWPTITPLG